MVTLTASAILAVQRFVSDSDSSVAGLRVIVSSSGCNRLHYGLRLEQRAQPSDQVLDCGAFKLFIDHQTAPLIAGATIDFVVDQDASGFRFTNLKARDH